MAKLIRSLFFAPIHNLKNENVYSQIKAIKYSFSEKMKHMFKSNLPNKFKKDEDDKIF